MAFCTFLLRRNGYSFTSSKIVVGGGGKSGGKIIRIGAGERFSRIFFGVFFFTLGRLSEFSRVLFMRFLCHYALFPTQSSRVLVLRFLSHYTLFPTQVFTGNTFYFCVFFPTTSSFPLRSSRVRRHIFAFFPTTPSFPLRSSRVIRFIFAFSLPLRSLPQSVFARFTNALSFPLSESWNRLTQRLYCLYLMS